MAHHVHHVQAIVLSAEPRGEADLRYALLTGTFGLIHARARSVRLARSRLRYTLQVFTHINVDLIRGREGWKIISARPHAPRTLMGDTHMHRHTAAGSLGLLSRLVQGEGGDPALFTIVLHALLGFRDAPVASLRDRELLFAVRLLSHLGYWQDSDPSSIADLSDDEAISLISRDRPSFRARVREAIAESHL